MGAAFGPHAGYRLPPPTLGCGEHVSPGPYARHAMLLLIPKLLISSIMTVRDYNAYEYKV